MDDAFSQNLVTTTSVVDAYLGFFNTYLPGTTIRVELRYLLTHVQYEFTPATPIASTHKKALISAYEKSFERENGFALNGTTLSITQTDQRIARYRAFDVTPYQNLTFEDSSASALVRTVKQFSPHVQSLENASGLGKGLSYHFYLKSKEGVLLGGFNRPECFQLDDAAMCIAIDMSVKEIIQAARRKVEAKATSIFASIAFAYNQYVLTFVGKRRIFPPNTEDESILEIWNTLLGIAPSQPVGVKRSHIEGYNPLDAKELFLDIGLYFAISNPASPETQTEFNQLVRDIEQPYEYILSPSLSPLNPLRRLVEQQF